jgi:hypothetical protein
MRGQFGNRERVRLLPSPFSQRMATTDMDWCPSTKIGKPEVHAAIAAERGAKERKQALILVDRKKLTVAKRPSFRRKDEAHDPYLG